LIQVTYQKKDGTILNRIRNTALDYKIGDITSMGWKILNIEYNYNGKYYSKYDYEKMMMIAKKKQHRIKQLKFIFKKSIITLLNYLIGLIIINLIYNI
jgi:hypothetical protein